MDEATAEAESLAVPHAERSQIHTGPPGSLLHHIERLGSVADGLLYGPKEQTDPSGPNLAITLRTMLEIVGDLRRCCIFAAGPTQADTQSEPDTGMSEAGTELDLEDLDLSPEQLEKLQDKVDRFKRRRTARSAPYTARQLQAGAVTSA